MHSGACRATHRWASFELTLSFQKGSRPNMHTLYMEHKVSVTISFIYTGVLRHRLDLSFSSTYDDLTLSNCTSCAVLEDKSAYWTPSLMFFHDNGTVEMVPQVGGMLVCVDCVSKDSNTDTVSAIIYCSDRT
jgi:hypothetical protein